MKTLYLGFYDFPYGCDAYVIKNDEFVEYKMDSDDLYSFGELCNIPWYLKEEQKLLLSNKLRAKLDKYFQEFDRIIACEDGTFYLLK